MLIVVDLGFRAAALVVCCVFFPVVISFVIRRKWRLAAARREEIQRLLVLASEEAALAELEARTIGYGGVQVSSELPDHECPVCFSPAKKRCKRCKAVWYCSGKCQIIHWRQGHKDVCYPPLASLKGGDAGSGFPLSAVEQEYHADDVARFRTGLFEKPSQSTYKGSEPNNFNHSQEELSGEDDDDKLDHSSNEVRSVVSKASGISASSGYHKTSPSDKPCSHGSVPVVDSLNDLDTSDGRHFDSTSDKLETCFNMKSMEQAKLLPQKLTTMAEPIDDLHSSTVLKGDRKCRTTSSSGLSVGLSEASSSAGLSSSSDFWDGSLKSNKVRKHDQTDSANSNLYRASDRDLLDSRSSLRFSFKLSGHLAPGLRSQGSEVSNDNYSGTSGISMLTDESSLLEKDQRSASGGCSSTLSIAEQASTLDYDGKQNAFVTKSGPLSSSASFVHSSSIVNRSVADDASKASGFPSSGLEGRKCINSAHTGGTGMSSVPEMVGSPRTYGYPSSPGNKGHTSPVVKSVKPDRFATSDPATNIPQNSVVGQKASMVKVADQLRTSKLLKSYSSVVRSDVVGKHSEKSLFPYELFVKLYNWKEVELHPCGLINCGNSCYANVVLQCLAFTPPLTSYLLQGLHSKACVRNEWCFTCELERLILETKKAGSVLSPIGILSYIKKNGSHLANGRQEDAHEFLRYVVDTMQSICLQEAGVSKSGALEEETTLVGLTFSGYLRSKITCKRCRGKSERHERMMDLAVEIEGDIGTLEEALQKFTGSECLDGDNKYQCSRCRSYEKAKKKLSISEAPNVLTIALKRFQADGSGKLNKSIDFPEILNLAPYMRGAYVESPVYRLYGVVVHLDAMNSTASGHYVCYVRNAQNKWFEIDDSRVRGVELERVLKKGAYMLFYSRCSACAPRSIRNSLISHDQIMRKHSDGDPSRSVDRSASFNTMHRDEMRFSRIPNALEMDSSSDSSSIFSHSDEVSCSTDSTRETTSIDEISDSLFGDIGYGWSSNWRNSSDSDTSSSSSSSPHSTRRAPLSKPVRYASSHSETTIAQNYDMHPTMNSDPRARKPVETCRPHDLSKESRATFLHSESSKPSRKLVNSSSSSSCRETDSERLGRPNLLDNVKSDVYRRRSLTSRTGAD